MLFFYPVKGTSQLFLSLTLSSMPLIEAAKLADHASRNHTGSDDLAPEDLPSACCVLVSDGPLLEIRHFQMALNDP